MFNEEDIFEDDLDIVDIIEFGFPNRVYVRSNHFENLDELTFFRRFRLYKDTVLYLLSLVEGDLEYPTDINNSISPMNQILCCLRYFASSGHLSSVADYMGMDTSTVSRTIVRVSTAIARLFADFVKMPDENHIIKEQNKFYSISKFPRVVGVVDGTHIKIQSPGGDDAELYRNRKAYFSLNVQVVGNASLKIVDMVARWPGSTHDATIFANSNIRFRFEGNEFPNCLLLGDSGYPLRSYFLTPVGDPITEVQQIYNQAHIRTRNTIERIIGIWKRRFPVIAYGIRLKLDTVKVIIAATAVLHNIARNMNEPEPPAPEDIDVAELNYLIETADIPDIIQNNEGVNHIQNQIINNYFANL